MPDKPVPRPTPDTCAYWEACNHGQLLYQQCEACGHVQSFPRSLCTACYGDRLAWHESSRRGTVVSFTHVNRAPSAAFKPDVPYLLALVDVQEGFRLMLNLLACNAEDVAIGMPVRVVFEQRGDDGQCIPQAEPDTDRC